MREADMQHVSHRHSDEIHQLRAEIERLQAAQQALLDRLDHCDKMLEELDGDVSYLINMYR
jgi:chromosome segregation ATPase